MEASGRLMVLRWRMAMNFLNFKTPIILVVSEAANGFSRPLLLHYSYRSISIIFWGFANRITDKYNVRVGKHEIAEYRQL